MLQGWIGDSGVVMGWVGEMSFCEISPNRSGNSHFGNRRGKSCQKYTCVLGVYTDQGELAWSMSYRFLKIGQSVFNSAHLSTLSR